MSDKYIEVFPQFQQIKGFFSLKSGAADGYPYDRNDVFREAGLADAVPVWPKQIHKDHIEVITEKPSQPLKMPDTDGLITNVKGVLLTTVHADCLPVYFFDPEKEVIGLVHAGWRGTVAGIAPKAAEMMSEKFGCRRENIFAYIGPGISKCCFETGPEVYEEFGAKWSFIHEFAKAAAPGMQTEAGGKYYIDLKGINRRQLEETGLVPEHIEASHHCTCCEPELFCSYRREGGTYKRMGAGLCML